ncbi:MAG: hypothetical protein CR959_00320 [Fusobacteriales bacterium]|nr:MAG: hypothetical protein CR959_00320 [Fusobacteriales bacterium]
MIDLLKKIREVSDVECRIGEYNDELIHCMPVIVLTPMSEKWEYNLLGNPDNKNIRFRMNYYDDHVGDNFDLEYEKAILKIKELLKNEEVKAGIITYVGTEIKTQLLEENTIINVVAEINLKLDRR